jgi:fructosamine-3-kinase
MLTYRVCFVFSVKKMIPFVIVPKVEELLSGFTGKSARIEESRMLGGGSINEACRLKFGAESFFAKWNLASHYPGMFETEARGLELLEASQTLALPRVIGTGEADKYAFLVLSFVSQGSTGVNFWSKFGRGLARLHQHAADQFGLDHDNYIGSLRQYNKQTDDWPTFFVEQRIEPQLRLATESGLADRALLRDFEKLASKIESIFPPEPASLLHGDLWSGNFLCNSQGEPVLIDPAVYYGHREMDIGMTKLFGGFDRHFYNSYNEEWPMEGGWQQRTDLCNLYPLLVHVNLFGGSYLMQVKSIVRRFV